MFLNESKQTSGRPVRIDGMENETKQTGGNKTGLIVVVLLLLVTCCCCGGVFCAGGTRVWHQEDGKGAPPVQVEEIQE